MAERVIGLSGKAVEVATPESIESIPIASAQTLGLVKVGSTVECSEEGVLNVCAAEPVDDLIFDQPEDYSGIAAALMATRGEFNELLASLRAAGLLKERV